MSTSTDGILAYGYSLGDFSEIGFIDPDGRALDGPSWLDEDDPDTDFVDQAVDWLIAAAFVGGTAEDHDLYKDRGEAQALLGVWIEVHRSEWAPMYLLAAKVITASRGFPEVVDLSLPDRADERLSWALGVLGIKPKADKPVWLLTSYWDRP